jgi:hypothetical protein
MTISQSEARRLKEAAEQAAQQHTRDVEQLAARLELRERELQAKQQTLERQLAEKQRALGDALAQLEASRKRQVEREEEVLSRRPCAAQTALTTHSDGEANCAPESLLGTRSRKVGSCRQALAAHLAAGAATSCSESRRGRRRPAPSRRSASASRRSCRRHRTSSAAVRSPSRANLEGAWPTPARSSSSWCACCPRAAASPA